MSILSGLTVKPLLIALAVSLAANASLGWLWLGARDNAAVASERAVTATESARKCGSGVDKLNAENEAKSAAADKAVADAKKAATPLRQRADRILAAPPASADDCEAAKAVADDFLASRVKQ